MGSSPLDKGSPTDTLPPPAFRSRLPRLVPRVAGWRRPRGSSRPWNAVSWWYSLFFAVPLLGLLGTVLLGAGGEPRQTIALTTIDAYTGQPLGGAALVAADETLTSDRSGRIELDAPDAALTVTVSRDGYAPASLEVAPGATALSLALRPTTLSGLVTDDKTGAPLPGVRVTAAAPTARKR